MHARLWRARAPPSAAAAGAAATPSAAACARAAGAPNLRPAAQRVACRSSRERQPLDADSPSDEPPHLPGRRRRRTSHAGAARPPGAADGSSSPAPAAKPRKQRQQKQQQQPPEPQSIAYAVSSTVSSWTDPNRSSVYLDEAPSSSTSSTSSLNGSSTSSLNGSNSTSSSFRGGTGDEASRTDSIRGLIHGATVRFSDSAALRLRRRAMVVWEEAGPRSVLIVKKPQVAAAAATLQEMAAWLQLHGLQVFVERSVQQTEFPNLDAFDPGVTKVDFSITLGGDGTVLYTSSLFPEDAPLPPLLCFALGSLGFLTPFDAAQFRSCLARVLAANRTPLYCTLRTRKRCAVLDADGKVRRVHHILNECVIDRGAFPSSVYLEVFIDGAFVTAAEADGLIIATPSGSTAYSLSAGGPVCAPSVPCTLLTPLSPHSLSFRPLVIPESADLMVRVPEASRADARASFDGKHPQRIARGHAVSFTTSLCPLPLINIGQLDTDFYEGITRKLKWNQSIRGVPTPLNPALLRKAAAAAAAAGPPSASTTAAAALKPPLSPQLTPAQISLGGLMDTLEIAAAHEAKVAGWVEEAIPGIHTSSSSSRDSSSSKEGSSREGSKSA